MAGCRGAPGRPDRDPRAASESRRRATRFRIRSGGARGGCRRLAVRLPAGRQHARARSRARSARTSRASSTKDPFKPQNLGGGGGGPLGRLGRGPGAATPRRAVAVARPTRPWPTPHRWAPPVAAPATTRAPTPAVRRRPQTFYYTYAADVRFGKEGNLDRKTLSQFRSLPSSQDPVVVFMGVKEDGETAIFLHSSAPRHRPARATASPTTRAPSST